MAKDVKYNYSGPLTGVTLDDGREVMLHPGKDVLLPPGNAYVKALVVQRLLTEVTDEAAPSPPAKPSPPALSQRERGPKDKEVTDNVG